MAITDLSTGLYTSTTILAALLYRGKTGQGQHVDVSLSDVQVATLANIASSALVDPTSSPGRWGTAHPSIVPYQGFRTKDGMIMIGAGNDRQFGILCACISKQDLALNEKFLTNSLRVENREELLHLLEVETEKKTTEDWLEIFEGKGMPYAAVKYIYFHYCSDTVMFKLHYDTRRLQLERRLSRYGIRLAEIFAWSGHPLNSLHPLQVFVPLHL